MNLMLERDTPEQCELFDQYLNHTEELERRTRRGKGLSYDEAEWEAFQYGWNAAIECLKNRQNDAYSDVLSSRGLDPRK